VAIVRVHNKPRAGQKMQLPGAGVAGLPMLVSRPGAVLAKISSPAANVAMANFLVILY
jgi:hypothetical protein